MVNYLYNKNRLCWLILLTLLVTILDKVASNSLNVRNFDTNSVSGQDENLANKKFPMIRDIRSADEAEGAETSTTEEGLSTATNQTKADETSEPGQDSLPGVNGTSADASTTKSESTTENESKTTSEPAETSTITSESNNSSDEERTTNSASSSTVSQETTENVSSSSSASTESETEPTSPSSSNSTSAASQTESKTHSDESTTTASESSTTSSKLASTTEAETSATSESTTETTSTSTSGSTKETTEATSTSGSTVESTEATSTSGSTTEATEVTSTAGSTTEITEATSTSGSTTEATEVTSTAGSTTEVTEATSTLGSTNETTEATSTSGSTVESTEATSTSGSTTEATEVTSTAGSMTEVTEAMSTSGSTNQTTSTAGSTTAETTTAAANVSKPTVEVTTSEIVAASTTLGTHEATEMSTSTETFLPSSSSTELPNSEETTNNPELTSTITTTSTEPNVDRVIPIESQGNSSVGEEVIVIDYETATSDEIFPESIDMPLEILSPDSDLPIISDQDISLNGNDDGVVTPWRMQSSPGCVYEDRERFKRSVAATVYSKLDGEPTMLSFLNDAGCIGTLSKNGHRTVRSRGMLIPQLPLKLKVEAGMFMHGRLYLFDSSPAQKVWSFKYNKTSRTYSLKAHSVISIDAFLQVCGIERSHPQNFRVKAVVQFSLNDPTCLVYDRDGYVHHSKNATSEALSLISSIQHVMRMQYIHHVQSVFAWLDEPSSKSVYIYGSDGELYELYRNDKSRSGKVWVVGKYRRLPYNDSPI